MKKLFLCLAVLCMVACEKNTPEGGSTAKGDYVDLRLPSGTKWKAVNELNPQDPENGFYTYDEAVVAFGENLPSKEQWMELVNECTWTWTGVGYKVIGSNGNFITLPAAGGSGCGGSVGGVGSYGVYWSSTPESVPDGWESSACGLYFLSSGVCMDSDGRCHGRSVRLVR